MTNLNSLAFAVSAAVSLIVPVNAVADNVGEAKVYGQTYGEWSAEWWQWGHSIPTTTVPHPVLDEGAVDCSLEQKGKVWFLAGKAIVNVPEEPTVLTGERSCQIPQGVALFFPIVNAEVTNTPGDELCFDGSDPRPCTEEEKRALLDYAVVGARNICGSYVALDGKPVVTLVNGRTQSPAYTVEAGPDDPFGVPEGVVDDEVVSDGYWMMVPPLDAGSHELTFRGSFCYPEDDQDPYSPLVSFFGVEMTYHLEVGPGGR